MAISLTRRDMTSLVDTTISRIFITGCHHPTKSNHVARSPTGRKKRVIIKSPESITINPHYTQESSSVSSVVADPKNHIANKQLKVTTNSLSRRTTTKLKINHVNLVNPVLQHPSSEMNLKYYLTLEREEHLSLQEVLSNLEAVTEVTLVVTHVVV
jgi:hypothetical protein